MAYNLQQQARRLAYYSHNTRSSSHSSDDRPIVDTKRAIQRISATAPLSQLVSALEEDGCVVITDFTTTNTLSSALSELSPHLDTLPPPAYSEHAPTKHSSTTSPTSNATHHLSLTHLPASQTPTLHALLHTNPLTTSLTSHFLALNTTHYTTTTPQTTSVPAHLSSATAITVLPSSRSSSSSSSPPTSELILTRPDALHQHRHARASTYSYVPHRDVALQITIPLSSVSDEQAPVVAMGSHLWGDGRPSFGVEDGSGAAHGVVSVQMEKGEALVCLGSVYQGVGGVGAEQGERSGKGEGERKVLVVGRWCEGRLRGEWEVEEGREREREKGRSG